MEDLEEGELTDALQAAQEESTLSLTLSLTLTLSYSLPLTLPLTLQAAQEERSAAQEVEALLACALT